MKFATIKTLIIFSNGSLQYSYFNKTKQNQILFIEKDITNLFIKKTTLIKLKPEMNFQNFI